MTTGELAEAGGVSVETVRYYERRGLLPEPPRSASGYRRYRGSDLKRLRFIRIAQELGFTLDEIDGLLGLRVDPRHNCDRVERHAAAVVDRIDRQMRELGGMRSALQRLLTACRRAEPTEPCPILSSIEEEA